MNSEAKGKGRKGSPHIVSVVLCLSLSRVVSLVGSLQRRNYNSNNTISSYLIFNNQLSPIKNTPHTTCTTARFALRNSTPIQSTPEYFSNPHFLSSRFIVRLWMDVISSRNSILESPPSLYLVMPSIRSKTQSLLISVHSPSWRLGWIETKSLPHT